jgi:hypothetical protein
MHAESKSPVTVFTRAIERWENEGGRVAVFSRKRRPTSAPDANKGLSCVRRSTLKLKTVVGFGRRDKKTLANAD